MASPYGICGNGISKSLRRVAVAADELMPKLTGGDWNYLANEPLVTDALSGVAWLDALLELAPQSLVSVWFFFIVDEQQLRE